MVEEDDAKEFNVKEIHYKLLLDNIFPDISQLERIPSKPYENSIVQIQIVLYGSIGSGKSETCRKIAEYLVERYGLENVNTQYVRRDLELLLEYGIQDKLINFLVAEDLTLEGIPRETLRDFFDLRHITFERTGRRNGLIITLLSTHRFHGIRYPSLRTDITLFLAKNHAFNPYDSNLIEKFLGKELTKELEYIEGKRDKESKYRGFTAAYYAGRRYMTYFPLATHNYLNVLNIPTQSISIEPKYKEVLIRSNPITDIVSFLSSLLGYAVQFAIILIFILFIIAILCIAFSL